MNPRTIAASVAIGRLAIGAALTAKPESEAGAGWVGFEEAQRPATKLLFRSVGARDMALGLGTLGALRKGTPLRPWLLGATLADVTDLLATVGSGKAIPIKGRVTLVALAGGAIVAQLAVSRTLD
jgi:hypothetical protein